MVTVDPSEAPTSQLGAQQQAGGATARSPRVDGEGVRPEARVSLSVPYQSLWLPMRTDPDRTRSKLPLVNYLWTSRCNPVICMAAKLQAPTLMFAYCCPAGERWRRVQRRQRPCALRPRRAQTCGGTWPGASSARPGEWRPSRWRPRVHARSPRHVHVRSLHRASPASRQARVLCKQAPWFLMQSPFDLPHEHACSHACRSWTCGCNACLTVRSLHL